MRRREFITLIGGAAVAWPLAASAQQPERVRRIGILMGVANDQEGQSRVRSLETGLHDFGWWNGRNVQIEYRWAKTRDTGCVAAANVAIDAVNGSSTGT